MLLFNSDPLKSSTTWSLNVEFDEPLFATTTFIIMAPPLSSSTRCPPPHFSHWIIENKYTKGIYKQTQTNVITSKVVVDDEQIILINFVLLNKILPSLSFFLSSETKHFKNKQICARVPLNNYYSMNELLLLCVNTDSYYFSSSENHHRPNTKQTKPVKQQTTMTLLLARLCNYFFLGFIRLLKNKTKIQIQAKKQ